MFNSILINWQMCLTFSHFLPKFLFLSWILHIFMQVKKYCFKYATSGEFYRSLRILHIYCRDLEKASPNYFEWSWNSCIFKKCPPERGYWSGDFFWKCGNNLRHCSLLLVIQHDIHHLDTTSFKIELVPLPSPKMLTRP